MESPDVTQVRRTLGLLRSINKSGEAWSDSAQRAYEAGLDALGRLESAPATGEALRTALEEIKREAVPSANLSRHNALQTIVIIERIARAALDDWRG